MTVRGLLPDEEIEVARLYRLTDAEGKRRFTQEQLASRFFVATITIRRALAEQGLIELASYRTRQEADILKLLKAKGINSLQDLEDLFADMRQLNKVLDKHDIEDAKALDWTLSGSQP